MTKNITIIFILGIIIIAIIVGYFVYANQNSNSDQNGNNLEVIVLDKEEPIPLGACAARNLSAQIIILESKYCGACKVVIPALKQIEEELSAEFLFLDLSEKEDAEKLKEFKIWPKYTPTVSIGCKVLIGGHQKDEYKQIIKSFLENKR